MVNQAWQNITTTGGFNMELTKEQKDARRDAYVATWVLLLALFILMIVSGGCSSYVIRDASGRIVSQGETSGFLRTITVTEKYKDGKISERRISTDSNTKDVLMGLDHFIDTTVNTASKIKP